jgi:NADPH:quinone reductase-like Zn-dependent oxidoreductase
MILLNLLLITKRVRLRKIKSIVEKVFPVEQIADAHRYYEKGHLKGKKFIKVHE